MAAVKQAQKSTSPASSTKNAVLDGQPVLNIGLVGHVDHGKTTLTQALSGKWTDTHSEELKRGITIRLGYADAVFYKNEKGEYGPRPSPKSTPVRKVSFIDAPGHESLMATMLAGSMIMDGALLLISANEACPQPQTQEHLAALEMTGITNVIVVQNKIDLVDEAQAVENYKQIQAFLKGSSFEKAPIIPISARHNVNIDILIKTIEEQFPTPKRNPSEDPFLLIARSFDVNKPGSQPVNLKGGILGGSLVQGILKEGDTIEIRPGRIYEKKNQLVWTAYKTKIVGIMTGSKPAKSIVPGGSVALLTQLDPSIVKSDKLVGSVVGLPEKLPPVWNELVLEVHLLSRIVGSKEEAVVEPLRKHEPLMLNVNSGTTVGVIADLSKKKMTCKLKRPICAAIGSRVTISRRVENRFRLIGYGILKE